jgi:hypothetical protein
MMSAHAQLVSLVFLSAAILGGCANSTNQQAVFEAAKTAHKDAETFCDSMLNDPIIQPIFKNTQKVVSASVPIQMLANETFVLPDEKPLVALWSDNVNKCQDRTLSSQQKYRHRLLIDELQEYFVVSNTLRADLYAGKLTWGQYNKGRSMLFVDHARAAAEIQSALIAQDDALARQRQQAASTALQAFGKALVQMGAPQRAPGVNCVTYPGPGGSTTTRCN